MRVKQVTLQGFKSFAKKSDFTFPSPVTAIVGPNGSGKSNVVEAVRFVLGEQSMKSMRGRAGADLIFNGSKATPAMSRAAVSIVFDNHDRIFSLETDSTKEIKVDYDEIKISRVVYKDGSNTYLINDTEVRLKDVLQLLASVNVGSSGHHIISQGEADRILNASARDRKEMIEDALGLKVYQYRIKESERKLEKTSQNVKEVQSLRREIAPHIKFLKGQVEKVEEARALQQKLEGHYQTYLKCEEVYLSKREQELRDKQRALEQEIQRTEHARKETHTATASSVREDIPEDRELTRLAEQLRAVRSKKEEISRALGRIEGVIEFERKHAEAQHGREVTIPVHTIEKVTDRLSEIQREIEQHESSEKILSGLKELRILLGDFITEREDTKSPATLAGYQEELAVRTKELEGVIAEERSIEEKMEGLRRQMQERQTKAHEAEREVFSLDVQLKELRSKQEVLEMKFSELKRDQRAFEEELKEGGVLIGARVFDYRTHELPESIMTEGRAAQHDRRRELERMKIRLEDIGSGSGGEEVLKEYEEVTERDAFLQRELADLESSMQSLQELIVDLRNRLHREFAAGIEKINEQFQNFFTLMFGGGRAFLTLVVQERRNADDEDEEGHVEHGIEISVSLPNKKAKGLTMLSGGERSLTSIALLFAISQVNPPPFLVLDETDAALDEANSRKYGDMLGNLSQYSQLIVVTHNRETMSRADVLYGVTIGKDGSSKLLSIKFEEAQQIAK